MSTLRESFEHFRDGDFSDEELAHASGLSERALREMLKFGAVKTFRGGKGTGNKRSWKRKALNTSSIARACNLAGLSLPMAARLSVQYLDMYVFQNSDPMLNLAKWEQLGAEHPISRWISDEFTVSKVDPLFDGYIHITDGWLVTVQVGPGKYTDDYADAAEALDMSRSHIAILSPDGTRLKLWQARRTRMRSSDEIKDH